MMSTETRRRRWYLEYFGWRFKPWEEMKTRRPSLVRSTDAESALQTQQTWQISSHRRDVPPDLVPLAAVMFLIVRLKKIHQV